MTSIIPANISVNGRPPRGGRGLKSHTVGNLLSIMASPPSRGAWIEIKNGVSGPYETAVAPLAGGVD